MNKLPGGEEINRLRVEKNLTYREIGEKFDASRQAAYKLHRKWGQANGIDIRTRPVRNANKEN